MANHASEVLMTPRPEKSATDVPHEPTTSDSRRRTVRDVSSERRPNEPRAPEEAWSSREYDNAPPVDGCQEPSLAAGYDGGDGSGDGKDDQLRAVLDWLGRHLARLGYRGWSNVCIACPATRAQCDRVRAALGERWWRVACRAVQRGEA